MRKKITLLVVICLLAGLAVAGYFIFLAPEKAEAPAGTNSQNSESTSDKKPTDSGQPATFDKTKYSLEEPASLWVIVNKKRPLPSTYVPQLTAVSGGQMRPEAANALQRLLATAESQGVSITTLSAYRSYATQKSTYQNYVAQDGVAQADTYSARPGHSEHQTGLAVDLGSGTCNLEACFGETPAGKWLAANAHAFGFIVRYQEGKEKLTGYQYEPWHLRYVGDELAAEIYKSGKTMEEFFGLPATPNY